MGSSWRPMMLTVYVRTWTSTSHFLSHLCEKPQHGGYRWRETSSLCFLTWCTHLAALPTLSSILRLRVTQGALRGLGRTQHLKENRGRLVTWSELWGSLPQTEWKAPKLPQPGLHQQLQLLHLYIMFTHKLRSSPTQTESESSARRSGSVSMNHTKMNIWCSSWRI